MKTQEKGPKIDLNTSSIRDWQCKDMAGNVFSKTIYLFSYVHKLSKSCVKNCCQVSKIFSDNYFMTQKSDRRFNIFLDVSHPFLQNVWCTARELMFLVLCDSSVCLVSCYQTSI